MGSCHDGLTSPEDDEQASEASPASLIFTALTKSAWAENLSVSSLVNSLKGVSSRLLRSERPDVEKRYWNNVLWWPSYFAANCGGAPLGIITQYVRQQKTPL